MVYQELQPCKLLSAYVECYWSIYSSKPLHSPFKRIFPDGCSDIIFNFSGPLIGKSGDAEEQNNLSTFVVGQLTETIFSRSDSAFDLFGIRFKPAGMATFLDAPLHVFTNQTIDLHEFLPHEDLSSQLFDLTTPQLRALRADQYLTQLLRYSRPLDKRLAYALDLLDSHQGNFSINKLPASVCLSMKQLERLFLRDVGVLPKQFASLKRFLLVKNRLDAKPEESLICLAADAGYTDHAHLTKSFKRFAGLTPSDYRLTY